jgi:hypothetical protein
VELSGFFIFREKLDSIFYGQVRLIQQNEGLSEWPEFGYSW